MNILIYDYVITDIELNESKTDITAFVLIDSDQTYLVVRESDIYSKKNVNMFRILKEDKNLCTEAINIKIAEGVENEISG